MEPSHIYVCGFCSLVLTRIEDHGRPCYDLPCLRCGDPAMGVIYPELAKPAADPMEHIPITKEKIDQAYDELAQAVTDEVAA